MNLWFMRAVFQCSLIPSVIHGMSNVIAGVRGEQKALCIRESGKSCPTEILEILEILVKYNAEGRPICKPMHM